MYRKESLQPIVDAIQSLGSGNGSGETTAQLNVRDTNNRNRANHSGTQSISTIVGLQTALDNKQSTLISGTSIKSINGETLLGSGNITISGGGNYATIAQGLLAETAVQPSGLSPYALTSTLNTELSGKQSTLISGTNIKTVNGETLLGSGNITISGGTIAYQSIQAVTYNQGGNSTMDNGSYNVFTLTADGTGTTIAHSNVPASVRYGFELHLNWTSGTITWPASWTKANGIPSSQGKCVISGFTIDGGLTFNTKVDYISDPYANDVILFLKGNGGNNSTNIVDSSPAPKTITCVGDTKISTAQSKYGGSSIYFDGSGDYLNAGQHSSYSLGTGDFTLEEWFYTSNTSTRQDLFSIYTVSTGYGIALNYNSPRDIMFYSGNTVLITTLGGLWLANSWNHVAVNRFNGILRLFLNGNMITGVSNLTNFNISSNLYVGIAGNLLMPFTGYQSHLRITGQNRSRYTNNFNPEIDTFLNY